MPTTATPADELVLSGTALTCPAVAQVARHGRTVRLDGAALRAMGTARELVRRLVHDRAVYGRTTGVGANRSVQVERDPAARSPGVAGHGLRLLRSHAAGAGGFLPPEQVRAMLVVRANQLAAGGSGVAPGLAEAVAEMLRRDALPAVHATGAIGTGDLTALAETALTLAGERAWPGRAGPAYVLEDDDALAFLSSNAATLGAAALACHDLRRLASMALVCAALTFLALHGNDEAYAASVHDACPQPGAVAVARRLRGLLGPGLPPARVQDPFGLRVLPQVHGPVLEALDALERLLGVQLNAAAENPLVSVGDGDVLHHGGFATYGLTLALDGLRAAVAQSAAVGLSRITDLAEPALTGLPPFLADGPAGSSGTVVLEYAAAGALADLRQIAAPLSLGAVVVSRGLEHGASFSTQSAAATLRAVPAYRLMLAVELVVAVRALRQQGRRPPGAELAAVFDRACAVLPGAMADRDQAGDLEAAARLVEALDDPL